MPVERETKVANENFKFVPKAVRCMVLTDVAGASGLIRRHVWIKTVEAS